MTLSMRRNFRLALLAGTALTCSFGPALAQAISGTWDGSGATTTTSDWNTGTNWSSNPDVPSGNVADSALFTGAGSTTVTMSAPVTIGSLTVTGTTPYTFDNDGNTFILNGTASLAPTGNVFNATGADMRFFTTHDFGASATFNAGTGGDLFFVGANTGSSSINLTGTGVVQFSGGATSDSSALNLGGNSTAAVLSNAVTLGSIAGAGTINFVSGALTIGTDNANRTFAGTLNGGAEGLVKTGAGIQDLTGAMLDYTGGTTVSGGALVVTTANLTGTGTVTDNANLIFSQATAGTFAGTISGSGNVDLNDIGTVTLSGANSYTGGTNVNAGTLVVGSSTALGPGVLNVGSGAGVQANGFSFGVSSLIGAGTLDTGSASDGIILGNAQLSASLTFSGVIQGAGNVVIAQQNAGTNYTQTFSGANTYSGGTTLTSGTLAFSVPGNLGTGSLTFGGGTLQNTATVASPVALNATVGAAGGTLQASGGDVTYSGVVSGTGALTINGANAGHTVTLTGANTYAGGTTVTQEAILSVASAANLGTGALTLSQGRLNVTGSTTLPQNVVLATDTFDSIDTGANTVTLSGVISDTGPSGLAKLGTGTLILSGANTYGGEASALVNGETLPQTLISAGTLQGATSNVGGMVVDNAALVFSQNTSGTFANVISGTGTLGITGGGTVTLSGANTYSGGTTVTGSTVTLASASGLGTGPVAFNDAVFVVGVQNLAFSQPIVLGSTLNGSGVTIDTNSQNATISGGISGNGSIAKTGSGTLTLTGINTYSGSTYLNEGVLSIGRRLNAGPGAGGFVFDGGTLQTTSGLNFTRAVTLDARPYNLPEVPVGGTVPVMPYIAGAVDTDGHESGFAGVVSGQGGLMKIGAGTLTLSNAANSYSGGNDVAVGVLALGANNAAGSGPLQIESGATFALNSFDQTVSNLSGSGNIISTGGMLTSEAGSFDGLIYSTGTLSKTGSSILTLDSASVFAGTAVNGGALEIGDVFHPQAALFSDVTVQNGGTLLGHGTVIGNVANSGTVQPGGTIGTLSVSGNYAQAANGVLAIEVSPQAASRLAVGGAASLNGTLALMPDAGVYAPGHQYTILTAGDGVSGRFADVTNASGVQFDETDLPNAVDLTVAGSMTPNLSNVEGAIDSIRPGLPAATAGGLTALANTAAIDGNGTAFAGAIGELRADIGSIDLANLTSFQNFLVERMDRRQGLGSSLDASTGLPGTFDVAMNDTDVPMLGARPGYPRPITDDGTSLWVHGYGVFGSDGGQAGFQNFDFRTGGIAAGLDRKVTDDALVGAAAGYEHTDFHLSGEGGLANTIDTYRVSLYGSQRLDPVLPLVLDAAIGYAFNDYSDNGQVASPAFAFSQTSHHDGDELTAAVGLSHAVAVNQTVVNGALTVVPRLGVEYDDIHQAAYTTSGATLDGLNLATNASTLNALRSTIGAKADLQLKAGDGTMVTPEIRASYLHDFEDTNVALIESFTSAPAAGFRISGVHPGRDAALAGAGVTVGLSPALSANVAYDAAVREHETDQTVQAGIKYVW